MARANSKTKTKPPKGQRGLEFNKKYSWDQWLRPGKKKVLRRNVEYEVSDISMAQQVRQAASKMGVSVSVRGVPEGVEVTCAAG